MNEKKIKLRIRMFEDKKMTSDVECFVQSGKADPAYWETLAWMFLEGECVAVDKSKAHRFFRKAREAKSRNRQIKIRQARLRQRKNRFWGFANIRGCAA